VGSVVIGSPSVASRLGQDFTRNRAQTWAMAAGKYRAACRVRRGQPFRPGDYPDIHGWFKKRAAGRAARRTDEKTTFNEKSGRPIISLNFPDYLAGIYNNVFLIFC
jgi:hypothetical protein